MYMTLAPQPQTRHGTCTCRVNGGQAILCPVGQRLRALLEEADAAGDNAAFDQLTRAYSAHLRAANEARG
jgi:hypothetical protein